MSPISPKLTPFPAHIDETARPSPTPHPAFESAEDAKRTRIAAFVGAVVVTAAVLGVAVANTDAEQQKSEEPQKKGPAIATVSLAQMDQVKAARDAPGVWIWGNKRAQPERVTVFDGVPLRDLQFAKDGETLVAVDAAGSVLVYSASLGPRAVETLVNANVAQVAVTKESILALTKSGVLYSIELQKIREGLGARASSSNEGTKTVSTQQSWHGGLLGASLAGLATDSNAVQKVTSSERLQAISAGNHHALALSTSGKLYSLATTSSDISNKYGQLGVGETPVVVAPSTLHPVSGLSNIKISQIATGSAFNAVRSIDGHVYVWGSNKYGQLGTGNKAKDIAYSSTPLLMAGLSSITTNEKKCSWIAAGGDTAVIVLDSHDAAEVYSVGMGQWGQLGFGNFVHVSNTPTKIPILSNLSEYSEAQSRVVPIRVSNVTMGPTHAFAVLGNASTEFGRDVFAWGANDKGQLARADGKKGNSAIPISVVPVLKQEGQNGEEAEKAEGIAALFWEAKNVGRLQIAGPGKSSGGVLWGGATVEQGFACGEGLSALYSKVVPI
ncbi:RCC1/BLIP-II protein [Rhizoclosmatium globosum]|uniref:RCC1/BLIP-II protein n=1 Tax=Rhizoclosmatium globosum TaxID=329046 RepID=A0A1Y2CK10_9FUNG|nr:RCC1/BLIP-II protein [Rhizoclosmatium globosum]|eukprot:ORY47358.1 RCC1/BLIP-II protein [Rhizoclosmatium globosum]